MLESIYIGMSGLTAYSLGLQTISNNVANMNTPGFKATTPRFADLYYGQQFAPNQPGSMNTMTFGSGVEYGYSSLNFKQGDINSSDGQLDLAIQGDGFLSLIDKGATRYARTGQFVVGDDGFIVDKITGLRLAALSSSGTLEPISLTGKKLSAPTPTTSVQLSDNLSSSATDFSIPNVDVYDANGGKHTLTLDFKPDNAVFPGRWAVTVQDENGSTVQQGTLQFLGGIPEPGMDSIDVTLNPTGAPALKFKLDFSSNVTSFSSGTTSSLRVAKTDGYATGDLSSLTVNDAGELVIGYSNGQSQKLGTVALASFSDQQSLTQMGNGLFDASHAAAPRYVASQGAGVGQLLSSSSEASNVDLSTEFGRLILIQRGFQASSQVITTANEMIVELFQMRGGQG